MRDHFFQRQLFPGTQAERKLAVVVGGFDAEQGGSHRQDGDGRPLGGQAPQPDGALLADLGVGREILHGQNVQSRKELRAIAVIGHQQAEKAVDGLGEIFGLLVAIYYNDQRTSGGLPEQDRVHRLRGGRQPGQRCIAAGANAMQHFLESRMASQVEEQVSNDRMNQG